MANLEENSRIRTFICFLIHFEAALDVCQENSIVLEEKLPSCKIFRGRCTKASIISWNKNLTQKIYQKNTEIHMRRYQLEQNFNAIFVKHEVDGN